WGVNHLNVFARGTDGNLWQKGFDSSFGGWQPWQNLGTPSGLTLTQDPGAVSWGTNRVDVFVIASDGNVWHRTFTSSGWGGWESWGAPTGITWASGVDASSWGSGHLDVFGAGNDGAVWHRAWDSATGFPAWESLGLPVSINPETKFVTRFPVSSSPGAVSSGANHVDLFARSGGALYQDTFDGSSWSGWVSVSTPSLSASTGIDAASQGAGLLDVFGSNGDGSIMHIAYASGAWQNPESRPTPPLPCFRAFLPNGIMEEFGCTPDSLVFYAQPTGSNAGKEYLASWLLDLITDPQGNQV